MKKILFITIVAFSYCSIPKYVAWDDNIKNPDNEEYVAETAFNNDCLVSEVTQEQFNERYQITRRDMSYFNETFKNVYEPITLIKWYTEKK